MQCGIIEVSHSEDAVGYACTSDAVGKCCDCGMPVCDVHSGECGLCNQTFCATCLAFHVRGAHLKKPAAADEGQRRKSA